MADHKLQPKQELFAQEVVKNGGDKVAAYKAAGYSPNLNPNAMGVQGDKLFNNPKIALRVSELQKEADKVAKEVFSISVEWRLKALKDIHDAGVTQYKDGNDVKRYENLAASNSAIKTMNEMLGVTEEKDGGNTGEAISINFMVNPAVRDVKVVRHEPNS
jgi:phage terminase small subunit